MQLARAAVVAACAVLAGAGSAAAQEKSVHVELRTNFFTQDDGQANRGGNPNVDEDLEVTEHIALVSWKPPETAWDWKLKMVYDDIQTGNDSAVTSGASSKAHLDRKAANLFGGYTVGANADGAWRLGGMFGVSDERDRYRSLQFGFDASQELLGRNVTWSVGGTWFEDTVQVTRYDGTAEGAQGKRTIGVHGGLTWVLSPSFVAGWFVNYTLQQGLLERPSNFVQWTDPLGAVHQDPERLPSRRHRVFTGLTGRYAFDWLDGAALEGTWRIYGDTFGLVANSWSLKFRQQITDHFLFRLRYRLYHQNGSRYWDDTLDGMAPYRTQDATAAPFVSQTVGLQLAVLGLHVGSMELETDLSVDHYFRSDGIAGWMAGLGLQMGF